MPRHRISTHTHMLRWWKRQLWVWSAHWNALFFVPHCLVLRCAAVDDWWLDGKWQTAIHVVLQSTKWSPNKNGLKWEGWLGLNGLLSTADCLLREFRFIAFRLCLSAFGIMFYLLVISKFEMVNTITRDLMFSSPLSLVAFVNKSP